MALHFSGWFSWFRLESRVHDVLVMSPLIFLKKESQGILMTPELLGIIFSCSNQTWQGGDFSVDDFPQGKPPFFCYRTLEPARHIWLPFRVYSLYHLGFRSHKSSHFQAPFKHHKKPSSSRKSPTAAIPPLKRLSASALPRRAGGLSMLGLGVLDSQKEEAEEMARGAERKKKHGTVAGCDRQAIPEW